MKKLLAFLFVICNSLLFAQATYYQGTLGAKERVLASLATPDNHYYVAVGTVDKYSSNYDETKGVTILQFGDDMKLIRKVKTKGIKNGKDYFSVHSMIAVGDSIAFIGTTLNHSLSTESTGLVIIDKQTLMPEKKITQLHSHPVLLMFGFTPRGETKIEFKQTVNGGPIAVFFEYEENKETAPGKSIISKAYEIVLLQRNLNFSKIISLSARDDNKNYHINDYYLATNGDLYFSMNYTEMPPPSKEEKWWEDEEYMKALENSPTHSVIYQYRNKSIVSQKTVKFENEELTFSEGRFYATANAGIYFGGLASNGAYISKRIGQMDTTNLPEPTSVFFAAPLSESKEQIISSKSCFVIDSEMAKMIFTEPSLSEKDKELNAQESMTLLSFSISEQGSIVFSGAKFVYHFYPLYETIKNNKNYTFTKDENGKITEVTGSADFFKQYHSLFTLQFKSDFTSPEITLTEFNGKEEGGYGNDNTLLNNICITSGAMPHFYYCSTPSDGNIYQWGGAQKSSTLDFHPKGAAYIQLPALTSGTAAKFTVIGAQQFWVVKGE